jgi:hypothetical protein
MTCFNNLRAVIALLDNYFIVFPLVHEYYKMRLKIPKGESKSVNRRRTDNTMATRKKTKGQKRYKNMHIKLNIE